MIVIISCSRVFSVHASNESDLPALESIQTGGGTFIEVHNVTLKGASQFCGQ